MMEMDNNPASESNPKEKEDVSAIFDPLGSALLDYVAGNKRATVLTESDLEGRDTLPATVLFRSFEKMPEVEKRGLHQCRGRVLDVGAGAGSHALHLQEKGLNVTAIDVSSGAVQVMRQRGLKDVRVQDFYTMQTNGDEYDTILCMMNGIGLAGDLPGISRFLEVAAKLLKPGGQIIFDSADLIYLFTGRWSDQHIDFSKNYYGELLYRMGYDGKWGDWFGWLFIDYLTLKMYAENAGWEAKVVYEGQQHEWLGCITKLK